MTKKMLALILTAMLALTLNACKPYDYSNCNTCQTATSGGQIMNNQNVSTQVWNWLDQFDTTK